MNFHQNPNPNPSPSPNPNYWTHIPASMMDPPPVDNFELSDYLVFDIAEGGGGGEDHDDRDSSPSENFVAGGGFGGSIVGSSTATINGGATSRNTNMKCKNVIRKNKTEVGHRVAFRTKSELEVMDDGFKWRKYGKKSVKNSPNPRNYYKCSSGGCDVKKRVERDREDSSYVITTYDGVHNHESPGVVYYNQMPLMVANAWTLQASSHSSSSS